MFTAERTIAEHNLKIIGIVEIVACEYNIRTSICEYFSDLVVEADGDVLTVKGKWCELVIEKETA